MCFLVWFHAEGDSQIRPINAMGIKFESQHEYNTEQMFKVTIEKNLPLW